MSQPSNRRFTTFSLNPGYYGHLEGDPRQTGVLRNTNCRGHREELRRTRKSKLLNGFMLLSVFAAITMVLLMNKMDTLASGESGLGALDWGLGQTLMPLWLGMTSFLCGQKEAPIERRNEVPARDYHCHQPLDVSRIFRSMRRQVLNQEDALERLERELRSDRQFRSAALMGPPGVGKTLTAIALRQHFPWPDNVHSYSWSTHVPDEVHKFHLIRHFLDQLSDCGQNLLIIDNLDPCDYNLVPIYNQLLLEREGDRNAAANQSVLVVYIFNLETEHYWEQFELLQQLPLETAIISYRPFGREELKDCINNELLLEKRVLNPEAKASILEEADAYTTGCKCVRDMILQHGLPEINE